MKKSKKIKLEHYYYYYKREEGLNLEPLLAWPFSTAATSPLCRAVHMEPRRGAEIELCCNRKAHTVKAWYRKKHKKSVKYAIHNAVYCLYVEMIILWIAALNKVCY